MEIEYAGKKIDLLPCPFCGGDPAIRNYKRVWQWYRIYCAGDGCPMGPVTCSRRTLEEAAADWNYRPKLKAVKQ